VADRRSGEGGASRPPSVLRAPGVISLAKLDSPAEPGPDHARNAVIVTGKATLTAVMVTKYWSSAPPVTDLHLIVVPDLIDVMNEVYNHAATPTCGDVDHDVPTFLSGLGLQPGVSAMVSSHSTASIGFPVGLEHLV